MDQARSQMLCRHLLSSVQRRSTQKHTVLPWVGTPSTLSHFVGQSPTLTRPQAFSVVTVPRDAQAMLRLLIDGTAYFSRSHRV